MKSLIKYLVLFLIILSNSFSQSKLTETPRMSVETHLKYLQPDNFKPEISAQTLNSNKNISEQKELAIKLKKIYDIKGYYIQIEEIPNESDYVDTNSNKNKFIPVPELPEIYLEKVGTKWLYSKETVSIIPTIYNDTVTFSLSTYKEYIPDALKKRFLTVQLWKFIGLFILIILSIIIYRIFAWIIGYFLIRILKKLLKNSSIIDNYIDPISNQISVLVVLLFISILLPVLELPIQVSRWVNLILSAIVPVTLTIIAYRTSDLLADFYGVIASKTQNEVDDQLIPLVKKVIKLIIIVLGLLYLLSVLGIEITPILAGASIGGLAVALAAQDTLKNFFGSITIYTDSPFEVGDWIAFDNGEGVVEEIRLRSTRIRTFHNSVISIPNGTLADKKIDNMGRRRFRRFRTTIGVTYDTPPELLEAYVEGLRKIVDAHPRTISNPNEVYVNELGPSSINILVYVFFEVKDWSEELKARQNFILEAIRLAKELNVRFAFPTTTVHLEEMPGQEPLTPKYKEDGEEFFNKANRFVTKRKDKYDKDF